MLGKLLLELAIFLLKALILSSQSLYLSCCRTDLSKKHPDLLLRYRNARRSYNERLGKTQICRFLLILRGIPAF